MLNSCKILVTYLDGSNGIVSAGKHSLDVTCVVIDDDAANRSLPRLVRTARRIVAKGFTHICPEYQGIYSHEKDDQVEHQPAPTSD